MGQLRTHMKRQAAERLRVHDARHTVEQGVHLRVVQEILGHAHMRTTEQYTHVGSPLAADAMAQMGAVLYG